MSIFDEMESFSNSIFTDTFGGSFTISDGSVTTTVEGVDVSWQEMATSQDESIKRQFQKSLHFPKEDYNKDEYTGFEVVLENVEYVVGDFSINQNWVTLFLVKKVV